MAAGLLVTRLLLQSQPNPLALIPKAQDHQSPKITFISQRHRLRQGAREKRKRGKRKWNDLPS